MLEFSNPKLGFIDADVIFLHEVVDLILISDESGVFEKVAKVVRLHVLGGPADFVLDFLSSHSNLF